MKRSLVSVTVAGIMVALGMAPPASAATKPPVHDDYVATFKFPLQREIYRVRLTEAGDIQLARDILAGKVGKKVPVGLVVYGSPDVNDGWSWHIDPGSFAFNDAAIEVCDGLPSYVEAHRITSPYFCPWSAALSQLDPAPQ